MLTFYCIYMSASEPEDLDTRIHDSKMKCTYIRDTDASASTHYVSEWIELVSGKYQ